MGSTVDYLPVEVYQQCQIQFTRNGFYYYLCELFDAYTATDLFTRYRLGTSRRWQFEGSLSTCFPQFDTDGKLRQVKVISYHPFTGRRAKVHQDARNWNPRSWQYEPDENEKVWFAGKSLAGHDNVNLKQCYFGEHLLSQGTKKAVALVEGESTAVVCSAIWPDYTWLATGGSTGGRWHDPERFAVLCGRKVVLWPDSGKYDDWMAKAYPLRVIAHSLTVSRYVEENTPEGAGNVDLRDLLTWPRYTPKGGKPIFGEVLPARTSLNYPAVQEEPVPMGTTLTLEPSPNREVFASLLGMEPEQLPLFRLART